MSSLGLSVTTEDDAEEIANALSAAKKVKRWVEEIKFYETKSSPWEEKGKKILRRFKDDRSPREQRVPRYNILWSVVESTRPALFGQNPKPDIERRFRDKDDLGRISSMVLERSISYFVNEAYGDAVRQAVTDRILPGRGLVWVRYEPHFKDAEYNENEEVADEGYEITDNVESYGEGFDEVDDKQESSSNYDAEEEIADEVICWDYVHWQDFGHSFGRTWDEVPAAWRKVYLTREELIERFGEDIGAEIVLDYSPHDLKDNKYDEIEKKATIYEIWDKQAKQAIWVHKDYTKAPLDEQDDPLCLEDFWPFPKPLFATLANDTCIPVPDYIEYQDQANELDELTSRIGAITKAVKVAGIYDASAQGIARLLSEGVENQLIPVDQAAILTEKGGLGSAMQLLPMKDILETLLGLYQARDKVKEDFYEISGSADIMRGQSSPDETATAQTIKSQFGTMRLQEKQDQVKRFCRDLVKIGTEIIARHFSIDTIKKICGVELMTVQEKQLVQMRMQILQQYAQQQKQMQGQPYQAGMTPQQQMAPPPHLPPLPTFLAKMDQEDLAEAMENPTWEEVEELLKDDITLSYKIDIETDSTIKFDQEAEKASRIEFLEAAGKFISAAAQNTNPDLAPLLGKMLEFGIRGFRVGKELETAFDVAIHKLEKDAQGPQKPTPEIMKIQADQQAANVKLQGEMALRQEEMKAEQQLEIMKSQAEDKRLQMQAQVDAHQGQVDAELEKFKIQLQEQFDAQKAQNERELEMAKAKLESETKIAVAVIQAKSQLQSAAMSAAGGQEGGDEVGMSDLIASVTKQLEETINGVANSNQQLIKSVTDTMSRPRDIVRDANGNITRVQ